ncbi:hypothetical protein [Fusobacterium sp.]|uniref:hypothetical protein n=1 Tax=Fusobacterium sp. TaxID=68766 RepID=UPI00261E0FFE|nr:hypothetical protein [Fusobacterium sp.]
MEKKKFKKILIVSVILSVVLEFSQYLPTLKIYTKYSKEKAERKAYENRDMETYYHNGNIEYRKVGDRIENYSENGALIYLKDGEKEEKFDKGGNKLNPNIDEVEKEKNGEYKLYSPKGNLVLDYNYKDGEFDGIQREYYLDSKDILSEKNYKNGVPIGEHITYYKNGKIETYKRYGDNERREADITYDNTGKKEKYFEKKGDVSFYEDYKNGKLTKKSELYFSGDEVVKSYEETYYDNGNLKNKVVEDKKLLLEKYENYYENGNLKSVVYERKVKTLPIGKMYYENGNLNSNSYYDETNKKLIYEKYYEDGKLLSKSIYSGKNISDEIEYYIEYRKDGTKFYEVKKEGDKKVEFFFSKKGELLYKEVEGDD